MVTGVAMTFDVPAFEAVETARHQPLYVRIGGILAAAIEEGRLVPGTILLEGPLASVFQSTRTPVRQALGRLEAAGLVARFQGRGYIVGSAGSPAHRVELSAASLGFAHADAPQRKALGWEDIYDGLERSLVQRSLFGRYRISEAEFARARGVGRAVARDVLLRLEHLGVVEKDERLRWSLVPLTDERVTDLYQLRLLLEPFALRAAAPHIPGDELAGMLDRLDAAIAAYPDVSAAALDELESDLHVHALSFGPNKDLLRALDRARPVLMVSKHILGVEIGFPEQEPFMKEHRAVLHALKQGRREDAATALRSHIECSLTKVRSRMTVFRTIYQWPALSYVSATGADSG